ncbi:MAG: ammonium transporter [Firmicutes bacterium]|nr:ammonium transporter [Alicyclobacillaceae bacterium]MCL6497123.1 ammonium transporter [Bacillota bacterium]
MTAALNTVWVIFAGTLVFFMEGGFALLEAGLVQAKNTLSIVMKVLADVTVGSLVYGIAGFALMYGLSRNGWIGTSGFFLSGHFAPVAQVPIPVLWFFEMAFAVAAISIVSGAVSERMRFGSYLVFVVVGILAYSVSGHWVWNPGGWLAKLGMEDFAGSAVVHTFGGFAALAAAWLVGPRRGRFEGGENPFRPSNLPLAFVGTFILWFGWFGFNGGSTLSAFSPLIGPVVVNTMVAAAAGGLVAIAVTRVQQGVYDPTMAINGVLAGLVAITAGCAYVDTAGALAIGAVAGILVVLGTGWLEQWKVDDPVGAFPVHGVNGVFGTLAVGLFAVKGGLFYGGGIHLLAAQLVGCGAIAAWGFLVTAATLGAMRAFGVARVSAEEEAEGLDLRLHGQHAYHRGSVFSHLPEATSPGRTVAH